MATIRAPFIDFQHLARGDPRFMPLCVRVRASDVWGVCWRGNRACSFLPLPSLTITKQGHAVVDWKNADAVRYVLFGNSTIDCF